MKPATKGGTRTTAKREASPRKSLQSAQRELQELRAEVSELRSALAAGKAVHEQVLELHKQREKQLGELQEKLAEEQCRAKKLAATLVEKEAQVYLATQSVGQAQVALSAALERLGARQL